MVRLARGPKETPPVASSRAYLRGALPAVYQEGDFGMRFIGALETLLDPIVAVLDALPAHFSADHAPRDVLDLLSAWLGVDLDESQTPAQRREMVRQAAELGRRRGTRAGLELALSLAFPKLPLRVEDLGGVRTAPPEEGMEPAAGERSSCTATSRSRRTSRRRVARCIEQYKPVHTTLPAAREGGEEEGRRRARMRTCQSCGRENPPDRDFCECGEYLRWEPTGFVRGGHARAGRRGRGRGRRAARAAPRRPRRRRAAAARRRRRRRRRRRPPPARRRPQVHGAVPPPAAAAGAGAEPEHEAGDDHAAPARRGGRQERDARGRRAPGRPRARARADPQPVGDRRQLPDLASTGCPTTGSRCCPTRSTWSRTARAAPTSRRSRSTCTRRARPRPRRGSGSCRSSRTPRRRSARRRPRRCCSASSRSSSTTPRSSPSARPGGARRTSRSRSSNKANAPVYVAFDGQGGRRRAARFTFKPPAAEIAPGETVDDADARAPAQADLDRPPARAPHRGR